MQIARAVAFLAAAALAAAAGPVAAQQMKPEPPSKPAPPTKATPAPAPKPAAAAGKDAFKSRVKPGLYEMTVETDMSGVPGVPKGKEKHTEKRQQCVTQQDVDRGIEDDPNCPTTAFSAAGNQVSMATSCNDGAQVETKMVFNATGYTADMKVSGKRDGKPYTATHKMSTRYVGPCPAAPKK